MVSMQSYGKHVNAMSPKMHTSVIAKVIVMKSGELGE